MADPKKKPKPSKVRKLNLRGLLIVGVLAVVAAALYFPISSMSNQAVRRSALRQAEAIAEKGDVDLALRHLDRYLANWPEDIPALELASKLRSDHIRSLDNVIQAASVNDRLLRLDPLSKKRQETRRRLVKLWLTQGNAFLSNPEYAKRYGAGFEAQESRFRAAEKVVDQLVNGVYEIPDEPESKAGDKGAKDAEAKSDKPKGKLLVEGAKDAEAQRLQGEVLEGLVKSGDRSLHGKMLEAFAKVLEIDPNDVIATERLALYELETQADPAKAQLRLDTLLKALPKSVDVRLARYRFFSKALGDAVKKGDKEEILSRLDAEKKAELEAALLLKPGDLELCLTAAADDYQRRQPAEALAKLDSIPSDKQNDPRVRLLRGLVDLTRQLPDEALEEWRKGLTSVGGTNLDLTFQLARLQIRLGRLSEAAPLVTQFQRISDTEQSKAIGAYLKGLYEQKAGHPAVAIENLERAQDKVPKEYKAELALTLGRCYQELKDDTRAVRAYREAVTAAPKAAEPRLALARLFQERNPQEAAVELDRALNESPQDPSLLAEAARIQLARQVVLSVGERNWRRLEEILARAAKFAPNDPNLRNIRADYLTLSGKPAEALALLERSARGPDRQRPDAWIALASVLAGQGKRDEALRVLEEGAGPDAAGDHASIRIARATMLLRAGQGQAAREALTASRDRVPKAEQAEISRSLATLCNDLGDREGASGALVEWSRQAPENIEPAIALMDMARLTNDEEANRLGMEILRKIGGDRSPMGLAAQALDLLKSDSSRPGPPSPEKLDRAERLVEQLKAEAPRLPLGHLVRGMLLEAREQLSEAAAEYETAFKESNSPQPLMRLVMILTRLKQYDKLAEVQKRYEERAGRGRTIDLTVGFDRFVAAAALKAGDKNQAEAYAARIVKQLPDSVEARAGLAKLLGEMGKPQEAEATLRELVARKPNDSAAWISLVTFQALQGQPGEVSKTIEQVRAKYKGERPEALIARCQWVGGDLAAAASGYASAIAKKPDDLATLREVAGFQKATGKTSELVATLRRALKIDPILPWAARELALQLSNSNDSAAWAEAWSLVAPGSKATSESPEDRLFRAMVLSKSPESAKRSEAASMILALTKDLPASNPIARDARVLLAQALLDANQAASAEPQIAPLVDDPNQNHPTVLAVAIETAARAGKPDLAASRLARLLAIEPKTPRATSAKAWTLNAQGKTGEAIGELEAAVKGLEPTMASEPVALALYQVGRKIAPPASLEKLAGMIATRWPRDSYLVAEVLAGQKKTSEALASCRSALEAGSARDALRVATGLAVAHRDDPAILKEIDSLADAARSKDPKSVEILVYLATLRHLEDRYEDEIALYREARALQTPGVLFLNNMAWTLSEGLKRPEEALPVIDEAIRRMGKAPQFLDTRGVILARLGRFDEAIAELEQAIKFDPSGTTYFHLARTYLKAGKADDFRRCRDLAIKAKFDPKKLDITDRTDLEEVMSKTP